MLSRTYCSQYYPYAKKTIPCSGNVHELGIKWEIAGGRPVPLEPQLGIQVCDEHMQLFQELGQREAYRYSIVEDVIIGEIAAMSEEGQLSRKERR